jgi:hypothetical protein
MIKDTKSSLSLEADEPKEQTRKEVQRRRR